MSIQDFWYNESGTITRVSQKVAYDSGDSSGTKMCKIGNASGKCPDNSCSPWDNNNWIKCEYEFNWSIYSLAKIGDLLSWLKTIYEKINEVSPINAIRFRDMSITYSCIYDYYNQIYFQNAYSLNKTNIIDNPFSNIDLTRGVIGYSSDLVKTRYSTQFGSLFSENDNRMPIAFQEALKSLLSPPKTSFDGTNYILTFYLSHNLYSAISGSSYDKLSYLSELLNIFFRDSKGQIIDRELNEQRDAGYASFKNFSIGNMNYIFLPKYKVRTTQYALSNDPDYLDCMIGTYELSIQIENWSPLTAVYFLSKGISLPPMKISGGLSIDASAEKILIPFTWALKNVNEQNNDTKMALIDELCKIDYKAPRFMSQTKFPEYFLLRDSDNCLCITSTLTSVSEKDYRDIRSMCFDKNCDNPDMISKYGLTPDVCRPYCKKIYELLNPQGGGTTARNISVIDEERYRNICGANYNPTSDIPDYDKSVLLGTYITVPTIWFTLFMVFLNIGLKISVSIIVSTFLSCLCAGGLVYTAKLLSGNGYCNDNMEFVCKIKDTNISIPKQFCREVNCECLLSSQCGSCVCASGLCVPVIGTRPVHEEKVKKYDVVGISTSIVMTLLIFIFYLNIRGYYKWKSWLSYIPLFFILLSGIGTLLFYILQERIITVPDDVCCNPTCNGRTCDVDDGCGGICGCSNGKTCENGICV